MNIQPVTAEVASDDRLWHGMASCPCRAGSDRSQATVQVYVQGGGGPGPFTGSRPRVQTGSPPQPPYATLPTDRVCWGGWVCGGGGGAAASSSREARSMILSSSPRS